MKRIVDLSHWYLEMHTHLHSLLLQYNLHAKLRFNQFLGSDIGDF